MEAKHHDIVVMMVPLPCQSHLNQLLQLSGLIASYGVPVHYVGSAAHNRQARLRSHGLNSNSLSQVKFHDLPFPPIAVPDPDPYASDKTPVHLFPSTEAYMNLRKPIGALARELAMEARRVVIIYDRMVAEAARDTVSIGNAELYAFNCLSAFNLFYILWEAMGEPFEVEEGVRDLPSVREFIPEPSLQFIVSANIKERAGDIHNTCRLVDGTFIDLMSREEISGGKKQWGFRPKLSISDHGGQDRARHECLVWLDKQASRSVIYVSFGTTTSFTNEAAREVAMGLEQSKKKFIWVVREADKADIFAGERREIELPVGFEERVGGDGVVVRDWAPQLEILAHGAIAGFMTHCGWNSCFESLNMGVPVAAWPMHSDQPFNAIFMTQILGVGIRVSEWEKRDMVEACHVKMAVERLVEGDDVRIRAQKISRALNASMEEGGDCFEEIKAFMAHITR